MANADHLNTPGPKLNPIHEARLTACSAAGEQSRPGPLIRHESWHTFSRRIGEVTDATYGAKCNHCRLARKSIRLNAIHGVRLTTAGHRARYFLKAR
jgi:hypothetical protein